MNAPTYTIGQLAKATDTKTVTIRYYEKEGLLPSSTRSAAGYRLYGPTERDRLLFVRRARMLGFSLDEVRELLGLADRQQAPCAAVDSLVAEHLRQVRQRLADLQALESELQRLLACCHGGTIAECRIIESLAGTPMPGGGRDLG
ncbi:DNA-binding transcriptional MerR regulator [Pseudomonas sp. SORGH_AS199]|uniref:MerR family transcriptional regulator n=1 Tax=Pseudomonas sp. SORGH_AS_0199 TaxID=3041761 RepID=UPI0028579DF8|nr:helix-turn-helix domain-containing protein [Pseudomonas sp. SORGH_AS_0199]MDR6229863.1 DNA-binding transcriptional MerR regulator [Pseudomonas sp. SORGH_AS_0199]